jgi:thiol-disulfide isomerase/thioredoxin
MKRIETSEVESSSPQLGRGLKALITGMAVGGLCAALYVIALGACKPMNEQSLSGLARGSLAKLEIPKSASPVPDAAFVDASGASVRLTDFKGQAVVLNLWATWCAPCVKEMPTLAKLQQDYAGKAVKVVALSSDGAADTAKAKAFIATHPPLAFYQDSKFKVTSAMSPPIEGFPTTLLYDRNGRLRGIVQGEADWSSPEAKAVIDRLKSL